ncbi:NUDIX domain-containing protein [Patescibacteria group bacterium]|nr:NUDIX domain-containing protein [Patescibacteria group bacterium]
MFPKNIAIVIFHDNKNIILQKRGPHSKVGEKYGFFGGKIKKGENSNQAIKRELTEELGFIPRELIFWTKHSFIIQEGKYNDLKIILHIFLSPITKKLQTAKVLEGNGMIKSTISQILSGKKFDKYDKKIFKKFKNFLKTNYSQSSKE